MRQPNTELSWESRPYPKDYPGMPLEMAKAGSAVFAATAGPVPLNDPGLWWKFVFGADWSHPLGPGSSIGNIMDHPVVQIAYEDAMAYAKWAGKELPTEAEWEFAARGGLAQSDFAWGDEPMPGGRQMANYWQANFLGKSRARTPLPGRLLSALFHQMISVFTT